MTATASPVARLTRAADVIFGKTYELSLVKGYVARWGMAQAVRELIQNALDSESPFVYELIDEGDGRQALRLNSEFSTLTPQSLLLGSTSKADAEDAIGSFGEGYKIALLVLTREGFDVEVLNGDLLWRPRFRHSRTFCDEILVIDETFAVERLNRGLTFIVRGLDARDVEQIRASCLRMQESIGAIKTTEYGDILLEQPGKLYVGSLYICETDTRFGYNIKPKHLRLERDRQTVASWDLKDITLKCWYATGETERVAQMIADQVPDVEYAVYDAPELVKEECYRIFRRQHPGAVIASSPEDMKEKIEAGLTKTIYIGDGMYYAVSNSRSYRSERPAIERAQVAPHIALAAFLSAHRNEMRRPAIVALKALILEAEKKWSLK